MPRRAASVTQADIARAIRAMQAAGLPVLRVIVRADGIAVETVADSSEASVPETERVADRDRVVIL
ncbi:hypothetical protein AFCDBAGC_2696 [Methylobacterium cerastii]|uniref:CBS domain-containing protein n=1 Tax=Methylobacterium cerastii TaxID=932741 RepID=A0ABQ4QJ15_9HYPH|nr:hypothetical protein [Methylobacterium cerastii]GJD44827.1 hypothetical protein AFCDBAGC_2696 [Methylobacterium cerastii]